MNSSVITANTSRPPCPNHVKAATPTNSARPIAIRAGAITGT